MTEMLYISLFSLVATSNLLLSDIWSVASVTKGLIVFFSVWSKADVVVHAYSPDIQDAEARGSSRPAWAV